ncbi:hypothetical protein LSH36_581g01047 [Paralvinella palmiformis]|uniref:Pyroglutamyl-peptidase I n=1 Tax=Paralvinella palmiformis TaxID=53620 RepID=A0AAD9J673_9ANNE|nr:hypothetical protein LSH36_581g01047 [Paralvinella palmiformis]
MGDSSDVPKQTVVVTGFGPFGNHNVNASSESVKQLADIWKSDDFSLIPVTDLDVVYDTVKTVVPGLWEKHHPVLMVHVGVSGIAKQLTLEQCAHNDGYDKMDNERCIPSKNCCVDGARACISSKLDMKKVCNAINDDNCGIEAVISHDPGRYLCDFIYFTSLHIDNSCTAFIHVPPLDKPYTREQLAIGIQSAINAMLAQIHAK